MADVFESSFSPDFNDKAIASLSDSEVHIHTLTLTHKSMKKQNAYTHNHTLAAVFFFFQSLLALTRIKCWRQELCVYMCTGSLFSQSLAGNRVYPLAC